MDNSSSGAKLATGTAIYAVGTFGTKILMFLIAPLYTYFLTTKEMGTYDVLISTIGLLIPVFSLQISDAVYRWIIRDNVESTSYIKATYQFLLLSSLIGTGILIVIHQFIHIPYFVLFLCSLFSALYFQITQKVIRGLKRQWIFVISGLVYTCIFLILNIIQLCVLHKGVESVILSYIIANTVGLIVIVVSEKRIRVSILSKIEIEKIKELLKFSIPLVPNYLSWWIVDSSDRYIVLWFLGVSSNGVLAIAHKFPTILQSVFGLFLNSWQDLAIASEKTEKEFYTSVFRRLNRLSLMIMWILIPATKILVWLVMGHDYKIACDYIPFYYLGAVFQAYCSFYGVGYLRTKNTRGAFTTSIYGALINAIVNICMIKLIGLQAAAISTFVAFFIMWIIRERQNRKELGIEIKWMELCVLLLIDIGICVITIACNPRINCMITIIGVICFSCLNWKDMRMVINKINKH